MNDAIFKSRRLQQEDRQVPMPLRMSLGPAIAVNVIANIEYTLLNVILSVLINWYFVLFVLWASSDVRRTPRMGGPFLIAQTGANQMSFVLIFVYAVNHAIWLVNGDGMSPYA